MLSREQLEKLSLEDLQATAREFGIKPIGSYGKKEVWVNAMAQQRPPEAIAQFPYKPVDQMRDRIGLHHPGKEAYDRFTEVLDLIGEPTDSQRALLKMCDANRWFEDEHWRY